jgi:hypothetical protein
MFIESLEDRRLLASAVPTAFEQYFVELVNRARANPAAEAKRYRISLNEGPPRVTLTKTPKQPVAINPIIVSTARKYSTALTDPNRPAASRGILDHLLNGTDPGTRMAAEGYTSDYWGENLVWVSHSGSSPTTEDVDRSHELLFKDFTATFEVEGRGHRVQILDDRAREIGVGIVIGQFGGRNAQVGTQDYGTVGVNPFITGVVYNDSVQDNDFYTPGEGLGKILITATRQSDNKTYSIKTWASGGYSLNVEPGTYTVTAAGAALGATQTYYNVIVDAKNVKRDFVKPGGADSTAPAAQLSAMNVAAAGADSYTFQVTYDDPGGIKSSTLGADIQVTASGFVQTAKLVSKTPAGNGVSVAATYKITPPGGTWDAADNKTYTIKMLSGQVTDLGGNAVKAGRLGVFRVTIPLAGMLQASQASASGDSAGTIGPSASVFNKGALILDDAGEESVIA